MAGTRAFEYNGIRITTRGSVYPPAEDSFLLAKHAPELKGRVLDMGCGSGIAALSNAGANPENEIIGADINPDAVECARANAEANGIKNARFIRSDLFSAVEGLFDGIMFNPPYLPREGHDAPEETALSGGETGNELTQRFIREFPPYLEEDGILLLLQSSVNDIGATEGLLGRAGFRSKTIDREKFFFEELSLLEVRRS